MPYNIERMSYYLTMMSGLMRVVINLRSPEKFWKSSSTSDMCLGLLFAIEESCLCLCVRVHVCVHAHVCMHVSGFMCLRVCVCEEAVVR